MDIENELKLGPIGKWEGKRLNYSINGFNKNSFSSTFKNTWRTKKKWELEGAMFLDANDRPNREMYVDDDDDDRMIKDKDPLD